MLGNVFKALADSLPAIDLHLASNTYLTGFLGYLYAMDVLFPVRDGIIPCIEVSGALFAFFVVWRIALIIIGLF